ncbi:MAG: glycosyltransferase family 2 protein, partial [Vicinamibacterales bacterium]
AKINQASQLDQQTNSYHLYCVGGCSYVARHCCVLEMFAIPCDTWVKLRLAYHQGWLSVDEFDRAVHRVRDVLLPEGFAFLGVKSGQVRLRNVSLSPPGAELAAIVPEPDSDVLYQASPDLRPRVSIVTTVYDRVECLAECIRSVGRLEYRDYEHIVVSDGPPAGIVSRIDALVRRVGDERLSYVNLRKRHHNWGIAPAAVGLHRSCGDYVCFFSDDNGYTPDHVGTLVQALDADRALGFVYSSCRYGGRLILRHPEPAPAKIDLGQPMFRRELFEAHLGNDLPFQMMA